MTQIKPPPPERWSVVASFPFYEVSDTGRIRRNDKVRKLRINRTGYVTVVLWRESVPHTRLVARLVAEAFIGPRPPGLVACHRDGVKTHNVPSNLRWDTPSSNEADKRTHGTARVLDQHPSAKLNADLVVALRLRHIPNSRAHGASALAREYGLSHTAMRRALNGYNWKPL